MESNASGYGHGLYARSLTALGEPVHLRRSDGWVLHRKVPGSPLNDGIGCYPVFACRDWSGLPEDVAELAEEPGMVSVCLVADPFGNHDAELLARAFPDRMIAFKEHYVVDLSIPFKERTSKAHQRNVKKASNQFVVEECVSPEEHLDEWEHLYSRLVERHSIAGVSSFSRLAFSIQFQTPGLRLFRAVRAGESLGMIMWYTSAGTAYYHLAAYSDLGYDLRASFGLFRASMEAFEAEPEISHMSLGGGAGLSVSNTDGLIRFKEGWATGTRTAYFCGRVLIPHAYRTLCEQASASETRIFPAYRHREF